MDDVYREPIATDCRHARHGTLSRISGVEKGSAASSDHRRLSSFAGLVTLSILLELTAA